MEKAGGDIMKRKLYLIPTKYFHSEIVNYCIPICGKICLKLIVQINEIDHVVCPERNCHLKDVELEFDSYVVRFLKKLEEVS